MAPGGIAVAACLAYTVAPFAFKREKARSLRVYRLVTAVVAILCTIGASAIVADTWGEYEGLLAAMRGGATRIVEGDVERFVPGDPGGHKSERFEVNGVPFHYSSSDPTSAFHWTTGRGGPIRSGLHVRILEAKGAIVRLEVAQ